MILIQGTGNRHRKNAGLLRRQKMGAGLLLAGLMLFPGTGRLCAEAPAYRILEEIPVQDSGRVKPEHVDWRRVAEQQRMQLDAAVKALRTIDSLCEKAHLLFRPTMDWQQINKVQEAITEIEEVAEIGGSQ